MNNYEIVIEGNSLSALVLAWQLSKYGMRIILLCENNNWGGHFREISFSSYLFDPGMTLYEFTSFNKNNVNNELRTFQISDLNDVGRFTEKLESFISMFHELNPIITPSMSVDGKIMDDMIISNNIQSIRKISGLQGITNELNMINNKINLDNNYHPINKFKSLHYEDKSYSYISQKVHGRILHDKLWDPMCRKAIGVSSEFLIAKYHRKAWLPFYYPESLLLELANNNINFPKTVFSYPQSSTISNLSSLLFNKIIQSKNITVVKDSIKSFKKHNIKKYSIQLYSGIDLEVKYLVWAGKLEKLLKVKGFKDNITGLKRSDHYILFLVMEKKYLLQHFSLLFFVEKDTFIYRIQNQSICSNENTSRIRLSIELSSEYVKELESDFDTNVLDEFILNELYRLNIIKNGIKPLIKKSIYLPRSIAIPTKDNIECFNFDYNNAKNILETNLLIGPSSGFASNSMNHQILQGLKIAYQLSS